MSTMVMRILVPGYEDEEQYGCKGNAYAGFPDMWPEERYAEGALYREHKAMMEQAAVMRRCRMAQPAGGDNVLIRALVGLANDNDWRVKNAQMVETYGCRPVYAIPPMPDDEEMPTRWYDTIRWMDRQMTKREQAAKEAEEARAKREVQRRRDNCITIDGKALMELMGEMMPVGLKVEGGEVKPNRVPRGRKELQAYICAELAKANGWKKNDPSGFSGEPHYIYKII